MLIDNTRGPGVWPVMLTSFTEDGQVDFTALDALTDWYIEAGVQGLFAVCLSSEMYELSDGERIEIARRVVERSAGRVPVFASGTFVSDASQQVRTVKEIHQTGVDGVVIIVNQLALPGETSSVWKQRAETLLEQTMDIPLGLYECPRPYHRLIDAESLAWCVGTGRFHFIKETSGVMETIESKVAITRGASLGFYNANASTLLPSLVAGGDGFCGIAANYYPELFVWMCDHFSSEPRLAEELQAYLGVANRAAGTGYPLAAKLYLKRSGLPILPITRSKGQAFSDNDILTLDQLSQITTSWHTRLGLFL